MSEKHFLLIGLVLASMPNNDNKSIIMTLIDSFDKLISKVINLVIRLAPIGVASMIANVVATAGGEIIHSILKMLLCLYITFLIILLIIYPIILIVFVKVNPITFYKKAIPMIIMAFSTCSSNATIPVTMNVAKKKCGIPHDIVNLITAPAATLNMHANCMETPIFCLFAAQLYGLNLSISQIIITVFMGLISAIGAAGVPGGGILMITIAFQILNLPLDAVPWIVGVYTFIDLLGTVVNVTGDLVGMSFVAACSGELDYDVYQ